MAPSWSSISAPWTLVGLSSRESTHHYSHFEEMKARHRGLARGAISIGASAINVLEWAFPLMACGYVVQARI